MPCRAARNTPPAPPPPSHAVTSDPTARSCSGLLEGRAEAPFTSWLPPTGVIYLEPNRKRVTDFRTKTHTRIALRSSAQGYPQPPTINPRDGVASLSCKRMEGHRANLLCSDSKQNGQKSDGLDFPDLEL